MFLSTFSNPIYLDSKDIILEEQIDFAKAKTSAGLKQRERH
jgi:hypothetical protein